MPDSQIEVSDRQWRLLRAARDMCDGEAALVYDEVVDDVSERIKATGSIGKADIGKADIGAPAVLEAAARRHRMGAGVDGCPRP